MKQFKVPLEIVANIISKTKKFGKHRDDGNGWPCYITDVIVIDESVNNSDHLFMTMHRYGDFYEADNGIFKDSVKTDIVDSVSEALAMLCTDDVLFSDKSYSMISRDENLPIDACQLFISNDWDVDIKDITPEATFSPDTNSGLDTGEEKYIEYVFKARAEVRHNITNKTA